MKNVSLREEEVELVLKKYSDMIFKLALNQCKNKANAEDIFQEVFIKYMNHNKDFQSEEHKKAWLIRVTINLCKNLFLSPWFKRIEPLEAELIWEDKEGSYIYYEVLKLPKKYRTVIHLFYYEDLSINEISNTLKINENTIKSHLKRGREILKESVKEIEEC